MIYVTRHGQTTWNVEDKICGLTDVDLTEKGIQQAKKLGNHILHQQLKLDVIISSPLKRAVMTASIIGEINGTPIVTDDRLIEQNYGIYEGVDRENIDFQNNKRNFAFKYPEGESMMQVAHRIYGILDEVKEHYKDKNVLLVSHGGVSRLIHTYFEDMTNDEFYHWQLDNAELKIYEF